MFNKLNSRTRMQQAFDKEKITVTKAGKEYNVYNFIQEGREDTEIYPTLEKYGCIDRMILNEKEVYEDMRNMGNLRNRLDQIKEADNIWKNLPLEVRQEFGHSKREFVEKGEKWIKAKIDAENAKIAAQKESDLKAAETIQQNVKTDMSVATNKIG